jgi:surface protein
MFYEANNLEFVNLSSFDTSKVTNMSSMFEKCLKLTSVDLSSFNTSSVNRMNNMFYLNYALRTIYVGSNWNTDLVTSSSAMFQSDSNLVGGSGTTFDTNHIDKAYAHVDGGTSNPGYLTLKTN